MTNVVEVTSTTTVITENTVTNVVEVTAAGPQGPQGDPGLGLPAGGLTGQILVKASGTDYDTEWSAAAGLGTVTSVNVSGGTTGLTTSGGPITTSGTVTLGGTLLVANGGTGATSAAGARTNLSAAVSGANNDITSLSGITGGIGTADYVQFDTAAGATGAVGKLLWNDTDGTLEFGMKGGNVTLQIGQEQVLRVANQSGSTMTDGQVVYITGSTGNHVNVTLAQANSEASSSKTIAVITESIANNNSGFATTSGLVRNFDTSALTEGAAIWLSPTTPGGLTTTKPSAPNNTVLIGWCVKQHATVGVIYVHIANGYEVDELHDVRITGTPTAGSLLIRNATDSLWENARLTAGTGVSISNADKSITITNSSPDQVVSITGAGTSSVTGTYPNFTVTSNDQYTGTVTSVGGTGTVNGITLTGTVTSSGSLTLGGTLSGVNLTSQVTGTLPVGNGGTGATTAANARVNLLPSYTGNGSKILALNSGATDVEWISVGGTGTVTSVAATVPTGLTISGSPITTSGTLAIGFDTGYSLPTTASQANWDTAYTDRLKWDGGATGLTAETGRTSLGATIVGSNIFTLTNPNAITFLRLNADNTISALDAATFRSAIGAGTGSGTVTSVDGTGTVNGITLTGTVTTSGSLTLGGTLSGVSLTTQVSGTLPVGNGGTGATTLTGIVVGNGTSAFTTVTAPSGTVVGTTDTQTLTNKFLTPRVNAQTTTASPWAWDSDSYDQQSFSALANSLTINADAGNPVDGEKTMLRFKDNGTTKTLTFTGGASKAFRDLTGTLTVSGSNWTFATTASKTVYFGCIYNAADARWDIVAQRAEP